MTVTVAIMSVAKADILYENNAVRGTPERFAQSGFEFGEEIVLAGTPNGVFVLTNFQYEYFGFGPDFASNNVSVRLRFYANNGPSAVPGSTLFDSGFFTVPSTPSSGSVISYGGLNVNVPRGFTWTVEFQGLNPGTPAGLQSAGLDLYSLPTVGATYDDYWERSGAGGTWVLRTPVPGQPAINFGCVVEGTYLGEPVISRQPQSTTALPGGSATFSVTAVGTPVLGYQWRLQGTNLPGQNSSVLNVSPVTLQSLGSYSVVVVNGAGSVTSSPAMLVQGSPVLYENVTVRSDPERFSQSGYEFGEEIVLAGSATAYTVTNFAFEYFGYGPAFTSNSVTVTLRFYANDGTNGIPSTLLFDSGYFQIPATASAGNVINFAGLNVSVPKSMTWTVQFQGLGTGGGAGLQSGGLDLYGVPTVGNTYDDYWERSGAGGTWVLRAPSPGNPPINFGCVVAGTYAGRPGISYQPQSLLVAPGQPAAFSAVALGTPPLSYQWLKGGNPIPGATNSFYLISSATYADDGAYVLSVSNPFGSTNSVVANLVVNTAPVVPAKGGATSQNTPLSILASKLLQGVTDSENDTVAIAGVATASTQGGIISSNAGTFTYTPPSGFTGTDSFNFYVRDSRGAGGTGTVQVLVVSGSLPSQNTIVIQLAPGGVLVRFAGIPGRSYQVQRSTDLVTWGTIYTTTAAPYGVIEYLDTTPPPGFAAYRTLAVP